MFPIQDPGPWEIVLRLSAATLVGGLLGLNREFERKAAGLRTYAIVTLSSAVLTLTILHMSAPANPSEGLSRVIQGIITGIGFLGAGVIIRNQEGRVRGLTTASMIWLAASLGVVCGAGYWPAALATGVLLLVVLVFGKRIELAIDRMIRERRARLSEASASVAAAAPVEDPEPSGPNGL